LAALTVVALAAAFYFWGTRALGGLLASALPVSWEERMGDAFAEMLAPLDKRCADPEAQAALDKIVSRLTGSLEDSTYTYQVAVGGEMVNAFAAPGGRIVVTPGLLAMATRPEELAGVLAHEIEHVERQHSTRAMFREMSGAVLLSALTGEFSGSTALQSAATLAQLSHARSDETTADVEGMRLLHRARVDSYGMIEMFQKFSALDGNIPSQLQYISTHPMTAERLQVLHRIHGAADYVPIELLSAEEWSRVKNACHVGSSPDANKDE
jgi:predicted Zn-dependent protease